MAHTHLDGDLFSQMAYLGAKQLHNHVKAVDALNVFPVPDGDTGTNMDMTFSTGVDELAKKQSPLIGESAATLARGLLMGARGNSGVILSQLFRGFSKAVSGKETVNTRQFAEALKAGVDTAYQAVMKPVEGTILTVAREAAEMAVRFARSTDDIVVLMEKTLEQAKLSLSRTPDLLPVLKEVGVVDSGGQGLVYIYEGFVQALRGETVDRSERQPALVSVEELDKLVEQQHHAQIHMKTDEIRFGYCTEFMIWLTHSTEPDKKTYVESIFRAQLDRMGDSLLVVSDDDLVKVHIHAENPGQVLNYAQQFGSLHKLKIENMREQHANILKQEAEKQAEESAKSAVAVAAKSAGGTEETAAATGETAAVPVEAEAVTGDAVAVTYDAAAVTGDAAAVPSVPYGIIAVAAGDGIAEIFKSMGVQVIVAGGQTMNPSTEDFVKAIDSLHAENILILPNNSNIVMAAQQAQALVEVPVGVIPSKSVPQGMAALVAFNGAESLEANKQAMTEATQQVKTGLVTRSVRDTTIGELAIREGDFIGIADGTIVTADVSMMESASRLLESLVDDESAVVTILLGEGATQQQGDKLAELLEQNYPDVEVEVAYGGQPLYPFIFSVE